MTRSLARIFRRTLLGLLIGLALTGAGVAIILAAPATAREAPSSLFTDSHFYAVLLMIAGFVVALIAVFLSHRDTARGVHADIQSIGRILRDARHNEMRDNYPMELEEFGNIFQYLRDSARKMALANRRYFERRLRKLHRQVESHGPSSLLVIDIDHFKQVNDTHGHDVGDALIAEFSRVLRAAVRQTDFLARLGGDEFCVIYPYTPLTHAYSYAERLRKQLPRELKLPKGVVHSLRWTGGISAMSNADSKFDEALWRADQALMRAKQAGRNNTQLEAVGTHPPAARSGSLT